jgi:anti-anti-sigma factor
MIKMRAWARGARSAMGTVHMSFDDAAAEGVRVLRPSGNIDHEGAARIERAFQAAAEGADRLVVDLSDVELMTTPGIAMVLAASQRAHGRGGRLVVTGARGFVDDMIRRCKLDAVLTLADSERDAIRLARQAPGHA